LIQKLRRPVLTIEPDDDSNEWMAYINAEVRAACKKKGWESQIRRHDAVRDKPVSESTVDDYEWKLVPGADARVPLQIGIYDLRVPLPNSSLYYVLTLDRRGRKLILQHDTASCEPADGYLQSFTELSLAGLGDDEYRRLMFQMAITQYEGRVPVPPRKGRLRDVLVDLTTRFSPNFFPLS
jgi:hypothetical protein